MNPLFSLPALDFRLVLAAGGGVVLLLFLFFLFIYRKEQNLASYDFRVDLEGKSPRWIKKKANELIRVEAFRLAGDLYAHLGEWDQAAELYLKGGNQLKAAEAFLAAGKVSEAAKAYQESRNYERAASLFLESGDFHRAAEAHLKADEPLKAAQVYERGGLYESAAEIYMEHGMFRRAAEMYEKKGMTARAADALWRCYGQESARLPEEVAPEQSMPLRLLARKTGELFKQAGRIEEAVEAFRAGGWMKEAADLLREAGRFQEAAESYLKLGLYLDAAECFEQAGEERKAAFMKARHHLELGQEMEAIPFLVEAGEFEQAARLHAKHQKWTQAGEAFERAGMFREAAAMYEKAGELSLAASCYEKAGDFRTAAELYREAGNPSAQAEALEKAGDFLAAGENYFRRGLLDRAISALQKVDPDREEYPEACFLLGQVFREKGMLELAKEYFQRSVADQKMGRTNLENFYQLALVSERLGAMEEAAGIYERILVVDYHYKDAAERLNQIKKSRTVVETPSTPSVGEATVARAPGASGLRDISVGSGQRYTLLEEIGRGGMGIVYKARDNILERIVAYKVLPANLKDHPQALRNFFREARSAARLNHPNIVTVFDAGEEAGNYYIAMEYVEGETIKQILNREGKLPVDAVLLIAGQVCKALEYAHEKRIVHRDIKSSNIMWTPEKQVKLMDFGLAKVIEEVKGYQTIASGTPYYMSPEQTLGRNIDHRTDIYSLGITMFEMATGRLPFMHGDAAYHHVHTPPPEAKSINPEIPDELNQIILKCMQKKPEERFQSARELFKALQSLVKSRRDSSDS